jgi:hypothetical protein
MRVEVYKEKEAICEGRSGYSTTAADASPMRTKECSDALRPAYNILTYENRNKSSALGFAVQEVRDRMKVY